MFYTFIKRHLLTTQRIQVFAMSAPMARQMAQRIAGSNWFLFLVSVES